MKIQFLTILPLILLVFACKSRKPVPVSKVDINVTKPSVTKPIEILTDKRIKKMATSIPKRKLYPTPAAYRINDILPLLKGKNVGMVVNHTSTLGKTHLVDTLISHGILIKKIFAPEHGFRGKADAGQVVKNGKDSKTNLPIISLYGQNKKPTKAQIQGLDILVFDIQDVGTRFYTYISTMHYVMEACAEAQKTFVILDRPNPNGNYVAGCVREPTLKSFVGMHPIPIVHGLTVGELARMINGEKWLSKGVTCDIKIVKALYYKHSDAYELPIKPSPNLPNQTSILLYPSLCLFEATQMSVGRGTDFPFQVLGYPDTRYGDFSFVPKPNEGASKPLYQGRKCYGKDYRNTTIKREFTLRYLLDFYKKSSQKTLFINRNNLFEKLSGSTTLRKQIMNGWSEESIKSSWQPALEEYKKMRLKYLLYD